jgi:hypothetical protein
MRKHEEKGKIALLFDSQSGYLSALPKEKESKSSCLQKNQKKGKIAPFTIAHSSSVSAPCFSSQAFSCSLKHVWMILSFWLFVASRLTSFGDGPLDSTIGGY